MTSRQCPSMLRVPELSADQASIVADVTSRICEPSESKVQEQRAEWRSQMAEHGRPLSQRPDSENPLMH